MITAKKKNKVARITIADEGIGIHKDDLPYVFDRFYRASKSRSKGSVSGYGLGLSIAKKIVSLHNGEISAASTLGKETTFTIMLPLTQGS